MLTWIGQKDTFFLKCKLVQKSMEITVEILKSNLKITAKIDLPYD